LDSITCAPVIFGATEINVSCSIGLAMYPTCASDEVNLHKRADQALYVAKRLGKNQVFEAFNTVDSEELATKEQACQNEEKIKRAAELFITNKELSFQEGEKAKRASELVDTIMKLESANIKAEQSELQLFSSLNALAKVRDNETWNHIIRTQHYVNLLALRLHSEGHYIDILSDQGITSLVKAAPLHDIGKVGIPDSILLKSGPLTDEEWTIMKTHTLIGESVLGFTPDAISGVVAKAIKIAGGHHEKWDGTGYPRGLAGEAIPLEARIMSLADVYDALVSKRVYKKAWSHEEAVQEIISKRGIAFDPLIVDAFIAEQDTFREIGQAYSDY
jgi:response regulator RpfG family c-di-GMP phosphodiesterase